MATMYIGADTYGGWSLDSTNVSNGSVQWKNLFDSESLPVGEVYPPINPEPSGIDGIACAPSLRSRVYALWRDALWRSDNSGLSWTRTALTGILNEPNDQSRFNSPRLLVHPTNPDLVMVGTRSNGLKRTANGGSSFTTITGVPTPVKLPGENRSDVGSGFTGMAWDPSNSSKFYVCSMGNGVYVSTNSGVSFSFMSGSPVGAGRGAAIDTTGKYYVVAIDDLVSGVRTSDTSLWKYNGTSWNQILDFSSLRDVTLDPNNNNRIILQRTGGDLRFSTDAGVSFGSTRASARNNPIGAQEPGWLTWTSEGFFSSSEIQFDPSTPNRIWIGQGIGVWYADIGTADPGAAIQWQSCSRGIEQLVPNNVAWPPGKRPRVSTWDRGVFISPSDTTFPSTHGPTSSFDNCWWVDYDRTNTDFWVANMGQNGNGGSYSPGGSSYSTNNGVTWTPFPTVPLNSINILATFGAGNMFVHGGNIIWISSSNRGIYRSSNLGVTWTDIKPSGMGSVFAQPNYVKHKAGAFDASGNFFVFETANGGRCWKTVDYGATWTMQGTIPTANSAVFHSKIFTTPDRSNELWFIRGHENGSTTNSPIQKSTNGGVSWTTVAQTQAVWAMGFGAPKPGSTDPALYAMGFIGGVYGLHTTASLTNPAWELIQNYPGKSLDRASDLDADKDTYGRVVIAMGGSGSMLVTKSANSGTPPVNTVAPVAAPDSPYPGQTLSLTNGTWSSATTITYSYMWFRDGVGISGANSNSFVVTNADAGSVIIGRVTASNSSGITTANSNSLTVQLGAPATWPGYADAFNGSLNTDPFASSFEMTF